MFDLFKGWRRSSTADVVNQAPTSDVERLNR
jgi:hypothetical protein